METLTSGRKHEGKLSTKLGKNNLHSGILSLFLYFSIIMEITGKITQFLPVQEGTSARGGWKKQEFIIQTEEKFPKNVCITAWAEKVDELSRYKVNDTVKLSVNVESREYNGRWYTDIRFWKIESVTGSDQNAAPAQQFDQAPPVFEQEQSHSQADESDDLPF